eukprot:TRINITY_DN1458_c0_g1_i1.p1 TRINITY_DN1458_c0_g1~~TRINITY_DN1458_c0_g1_i1.p1  ORF type:complete len:518 (-),score=88.20 TRINITY_DN1458_c0_g1_i1:236-1789(-)
MLRAYLIQEVQLSFEVPKCKETDIAGLERRDRTIRKWLKDMPRPGRLQFRPPIGSTDSTGVDAEEGVAAEGSTESPETNLEHTSVEEGSASTSVVGVEGCGIFEDCNSANDAGERLIQQSESSIIEDESVDGAAHVMTPSDGLSLPTQSTFADQMALKVQDHFSHLSTIALPTAERTGTVSDANDDEKNRLRLELEEVRCALAQTQGSLENETKKLEAEKRKSAKFLGELGAARSRIKDSVAASSSRDAQNEDALQTATTQINTLTDELERCKQALHDMTVRADTAEGKVSSLEQELTAVSEQLAGFQAAQDVEIELLREEHQKVAQAQKQDLARHHQSLAEELEALREKHAQAEKLASEREAAAAAAIDDAQAASVEAAGARRAQQAAEEELPMLRARLSSLEKQNGVLQQKLNARVLSTGAAAGRAGGGQSHPFWLPIVQSVAGPRVGALSLLLYSVPDKALRLFTERLLEHNVALWFFYIHVIVLYLIVAFWYTKTFGSGLPLDGIAAKMISGT